MTTTTLTSYIVTCLTEGGQVLTDYMLKLPTVCPNDYTHTIDPSLTAIYDAIHTNSTTINHGDDNYPQYYMAQGFPFVHIMSGDPGTVTTIDNVIPIEILPRLVIIKPSADNIGDYFSVVAAPNTTIGVLMATGISGTSSFIVNSTAADNIHDGFMVTITNGITADNLGICLSITGMSGTTNSIMNTSLPLAHDFNPMSFVQMTVPRISNYPIVTEGAITIGSNNLYSVTVPRNTLTRTTYTNVNGLPKTFSYLLEYIY